MQSSRCARLNTERNKAPKGKVRKMAKEIKFDKCYLITRPRQYNVGGVTFTVTPVYDGKQGVDIKKQFEKCVLNNVTDLYIDDSGGTIT